MALPAHGAFGFQVFFAYYSAPQHLLSPYVTTKTPARELSWDFARFSKSVVGAGELS